MAKKTAKSKTSTKGALPKGKLALIKDPRVYAEKLPFIQSPYKRLLGLDLSSSCGASVCDIIPGIPIKAATIIGGQWNLAVGRHDTNAIRYVRFKAFLELTQPDLVFYEEVKYTGQSAPPSVGKDTLTALVARAVSGAQVPQSLAAILVLWAEEHDIPVEAIPIGVLKKFATGRGNANKDEMVRACNEQFGTDFDPVDYEATGVDNIADSMFLVAMAVANYAEGL